MSRDFIGSASGRAFLKSPNRDRIARLTATGPLVAREITRYWQVFAGGIFVRHPTSFLPLKYFRRADLVLNQGGIATTQGQSLLPGGFNEPPSTNVPALEPVNGPGTLDVRRLGATVYITSDGGQISLGGTDTLTWNLTGEIDLESEYAALRTELDGLAFPDVMVTGSSDIGADDTLRSYRSDRSVLRTINAPNIDARGAIGGYELSPAPRGNYFWFTKTPNLGVFTAYFGVQWVGLRLRDVLIGGGAKVWQFACTPGRIDLGVNDFINETDLSVKTVSAETSCGAYAEGAILTAPLYGTLVRGHAEYLRQSRVVFPRHKWTVPEGPFFPGMRAPAFFGVPPSCAPEIVGTSP